MVAKIRSVKFFQTTAVNIMFIVMAFMLINLENVVFTLSLKEMETTFYDDLVNHNGNMENELCQLTRGQKDTFCRAVFEMPRFKVTIEAEFNKQAFFELEPRCSNRNLSFKKLLHLPDGWLHDILPCFGKHKILRTNWHEDPFFEKFYVAFSRLNMLMYVFGEEKSGEKEEIFMIDIVKVKIDPFSLAESVVTPEEKAEEEYRNGIEVHTSSIRHVEAIYVRDMIRTTDRFPDPFASLGAETMLTVCLSIFSEIRYASQGIFIDRLAMFTPPYVPLQQKVYFWNEEQRDGHPQVTYPCRALHESFSTNKSLLVKDKYSIAGGRKLRSIFIFEMFDFAGNVKPIGYIENFDFAHLLPMERSETEIY